MADVVQDQISYSGLDERAFAVLRRVKPIVMAALPGILDRFYAVTAAMPELAAKFDEPGSHAGCQKRATAPLGKAV